MPAARSLPRISRSCFGSSLPNSTTTQDPMLWNSRCRSASRVSLTRLGMTMVLVGLLLDGERDARAHRSGDDDLLDEVPLRLRRPQRAKVVEERGQVGGQVLGAERLLADRRVHVGAGVGAELLS